MTTVTSPIRVHEGDKEVFDFALYDRDGNKIAIDDVTATSCDLGERVSALYATLYVGTRVSIGESRPPASIRSEATA